MQSLRFIRPLSAAKGPGLRAQLIRGATGVGGLKLLSIPLTLGVSILLARGLGPEGFGQYAFTLALLTLLSLPFGNGLLQLVTREVANYSQNRDWALLRGLVRYMHYWILGGASVIGLMLLLAATPRASWEVTDRWTLLVLGLLYLPFMGFNLLRVGALRGFGCVVLAQLPEIVGRPALHFLIITVLVIFGLLNPATALASLIGATAAAYLLGSYLFHRNSPVELNQTPPEYEQSTWAKALLPFTLMGAVSLANNQIGILLLGWIGTDEQVAALRVADRGAQLIFYLLTIVNMVIGPYVAKTYREGNVERLQKLSRMSARAALLFALPVALPMIFLGDALIGFVFGVDYIELTVTPLAILATAQLINVAFGSVGLLLVMSGHERASVNGLIIALAVNVISALMLIPSMGAVGAAYAAALGIVTWNTLMAYKVRRLLTIRPSAI